MVATAEITNGYHIRPKQKLEKENANPRAVYQDTKDIPPRSPRNNAEFPRSASYTYLGNAKDPCVLSHLIITTPGVVIPYLTSLSINSTNIW